MVVFPVLKLRLHFVVWGRLLILQLLVGVWLCTVELGVWLFRWPWLLQLLFFT